MAVWNSALDEEYQWLTFRAAAKRVDRDIRTIWRWKATGMPTVMVNGTNYVALDELLAWWRARLLAHPCMQQHRRRLARLEAA